MKVDYERAKQLHNEGQTLTQIAELFNVTPSAISYGFRAKGIAMRTRNTPKTPSKEILSYFAGFFDGEGHITIAVSKNKSQPSYWLQIGVTGTFLSVLDDFQKEFNIGHFSETYGYETNNRRCRHWRCTNNQAMHVLKCLLPYLRVKKDQATLAIEFQKKLATRTDTSNEWKQAFKDKLLELKQATC